MYNRTKFSVNIKFSTRMFYLLQYVREQVRAGDYLRCLVQHQSFSTRVHSSMYPDSIPRRPGADSPACDMPSCDMPPWPDILVQAYFFIFQVDMCCNYLRNHLEHAFQIVVVK
jgi:hypothetical protein